jgi:hypothetical protein
MIRSVMDDAEQFEDPFQNISSNVRMWLHIAGEKLPVLQSSKDQIKLESLDMLPRGDAVLEIIVNGRSHRHEIRVLDSSPRPKWVAIEDRKGRV